MPNIMYELKPGRIADIGVMRWWWWWPMFSLETPWCETSAYVCSLNWLTGPKTYNRLPFLSFLFYPHSDRANQLLFIEALSKMVRKTEDLFQTRKDHPSGTILEHVWGIIWGMSGACLEQHLGHIVNNGQQSAVLHASVMPFLAPS